MLLPSSLTIVAYLLFSVVKSPKAQKDDCVTQTFVWSNQPSVDDTEHGIQVSEVLLNRNNHIDISMRDFNCMYPCVVDGFFVRHRKRACMR